ncbi:MAG TPA: serine/threonine-protein kinase [Polyangiaceae bacterium]|nr:serine/threonine-protein kinase [Polyangiaceae bacterium]
MTTPTPPPPPPPDLTGIIVAGKYRVEHVLGRGAMGSVWFAAHTSLGHAVAIKFIHPDLASSPQARRRFETEAKAAAKLKSRHVAQVYDHGVSETEQPYIVMEFLEGHSLEAVIEARGALPPVEVMAIIEQAARALESAHRAGVVHRDLKPDNIMLASDPEAKPYGYTVKLVDFGIAKMLTESSGAATHAGAVVGTPHYMAPEALTGSHPVGPRSDVWSLGACAYKAIVGKVPFEGDAIGDIVIKVCVSPLPVPSMERGGLPNGFDVWFATACHRDPNQRFASATQAREALQRLDELATQGSEAFQYRIRPSLVSIHDHVSIPPPPTSSRTRMMAGVVLGASLAVGALGLFVWKRTEEANQLVLEAQANASASIEADNQRRLEAAEREREKALAAAAAQEAGKTADAGKNAAPARPRRSR